MAATLGRLISKSKAEAEINKYLEVREYTYDGINTALKGASTAARTYYSDYETSFVFELSKIEEIITNLRSQGKSVDGIRVYYAASPSPETIPVTRALGSTTLVIVPVKINKNANGDLINIVNVISDDTNAVAIEYPGGNKKENLYQRVDISNDEILPDSIVHFTTV